MDILASTYIDEFLAVALFQTIAVASPGPDFAVVVQNSLLYSRRIGVLTALGISVGVLFHVAVALLGVGFIIAQSIWLFTAVKIMACGYLFYLAYCSFKSGGKVATMEQVGKAQTHISGLRAFQIGVITNILNPKAILFFLSLFTVVIDPNTPKPIILSYGALIFLITLAWFLTLALCFSHQKVQRIFTHISHWISRITGPLKL